MKARNHRLERLKVITNLLADQATSPVSQAASRVARIEAKVEELGSHRRDLMQAKGDTAMAATMLGQAERLRREQAAALDELASARDTLEQEKAKAAKVIGRNLALERLLQKREAALKLERYRQKLR